MNLAPIFKTRFFDSNGDPLAGGKLYFYGAGTTTPQATFTDASGGTPNANPVILDANGEADVWLDPTKSYKAVLTDSADVNQWTVDNVIGLLTADAVETASLQDGAVTEPKIADDAVTADKLRDDASIDANRAVTANHIRDGAVTIAKFSSNALAPQIGAAKNIGISLASGVLTLTQSNGSALGTGEDAGYIDVYNTTVGQNERVAVVAPVTLQDSNHATDSDLLGEEFGTTAGTAWASARPFYLYAVYDDTDLYFAISPNPAAKSTPLATNIGYKDTPASTPSDGNFFFLTDTDITTSHALKTCVLIGGIKMSKDSSDDWAVAALTALDGGYINPRPFEGSTFAFPLGQMGAESGNYFKTTASPVWATPASIIYSYIVNLDGTININFDTQGAGAVTNGTSGVGLVISLPYNSIHTATNQRAPGDGFYLVSNMTTSIGRPSLSLDSGTYNIRSYTNEQMHNNDFTTGTNDLFFTCIYKAF